METWLNGAIPDSVLHLSGFQLFRADRVTKSTGKTRGGGLCFYINEGWFTDMTVLKKMCCPNLEALFINCKTFYSPWEFSLFILVSVYIPPDARVSAALELLADQITHTEQRYPDSFIVILGDFFFLLSTIFYFHFFHKQHNIISKIKQNKTADTYSTSQSSIKREGEREGQREHKSYSFK